MLRKFINILISILLALPLLTGTPGAFGLPKVSDSQVHFQKPCDMDHCDMDHSSPNTPKCSLCPTSGSFVPYLSNGPGIVIPILNSSLTHVRDNTLSDQGVVKVIFRPPISIL